MHMWTFLLFVVRRTPVNNIPVPVHSYLSAYSKCHPSLSGPNGEDYKFEYGANWIHGITNNPIHALAKKHGLYEPLSEATENWKRHTPYNVTEDGEEVPKEIHKLMFKSFYNCIDDCDRCFKEGLPEGTSEETSIEDRLRNLVEPVFTELGEKEQRLARMVFESLLLQESGVSGCNSMSDVSLKYFGSYDEIPGHQPTVAQGFEKVAKCLAENIPQDRIMLNCKVAEIAWGVSGVEISCDNGSSVAADTVIVTLPLGVLKSDAQTLFKPALPDKKIQSIKRLGTDAVAKVFMYYDDLDFLPPDVCKIHIARERLDHRQRQLWTTKIHSFHLDRNPYQHILVCWLTGRAAEEMESLTEDEVGEGCTDLLKSVLRNNDVPRPVKVVRTTWYSDPLTQGSYTYIPVGSSIDDIKQLGAPITNKKGEPVLMFAGEATHDTYYSTAHGAMLSGQREADRLARALLSE